MASPSRMLLQWRRQIRSKSAEIIDAALLPMSSARDKYGARHRKMVGVLWLALLLASFLVYLSYPVPRDRHLVLPSTTQFQHPSWPPTRDAIGAVADDKQRVVVVGVNSAFIDMFYAWARSAVNVGLTNIVIMALDDDAYRVLHARFPERTFLPTFKVEGGFAEFGSVSFKKLTQTRPSFIRAMLDLGFSVFYTDTDTIMRRNPFHDFERALQQQPNINVMVSEDGETDYYCSCMLYFSCDDASRAVLAAWENECADSPDHDDQHALNVILPEHSILERVHVFVIPESVFPSGKRTFQRGYDWERHPHGPTIVHANYMVGHDNKMAALENRAVWDYPSILPVLYAV